jgi:hypothetical protein
MRTVIKKVMVTKQPKRERKIDAAKDRGEVTRGWVG